MSSFQTWGPHLAIVVCSLAAWRFLSLPAFSKLAVAATLCLIFLGGTVTSNNAGLAVPDWPLSFGTINPDGWWKIRNILYEHGHRLFAQFVGLLTTILAIRIWKNEDRGWVRWLGLGAFVGVCVQGLLGGLRVTKLSIGLAMVHACTAQAFLCVLIVLSMALSPRWSTALKSSSAGKNLAPVRWWSWLLVGSVFCQLIFGAVMRHMSRQSGLGLAFHDFPLADGKLLPALDTTHKLIHFLHRVDALFIACISLFLLAAIFAAGRTNPLFMRPALLLTGLIALQIPLGAHVIWLDRPPLATSLHVVAGAAILGTSVLIAVRATRVCAQFALAENPVMRESVLAA
jgi:heme a synthase